MSKVVPTILRRIATRNQHILSKNFRNSQNFLCVSGDTLTRIPEISRGVAVERVVISKEEWVKKLTGEQYYVTRERGTELPFSGEYVYTYEKGQYNCICCDTPLFRSETKYDSGSGWPAFYDVYRSDGSSQNSSNVILRPDNSYGMRRTEVICKTCDGHLGHAFNDGPEPTGKRYCINSAALKFKPANK